MIDSREGAGLEEAAEDAREGVISVAMFQRREKRWEQSSRLRAQASNQRISVFILRHKVRK